MIFDEDFLEELKNEVRKDIVKEFKKEVRRELIEEEIQNEEIRKEEMIKREIKIKELKNEYRTKLVNEVKTEKFKEDIKNEFREDIKKIVTSNNYHSQCPISLELISTLCDQDHKNIIVMSDNNCYDKKEVTKWVKMLIDRGSELLLPSRKDITDEDLLMLKLTRKNIYRSYEGWTGYTGYTGYTGSTGPTESRSLTGIARHFSGSYTGYVESYTGFTGYNSYTSYSGYF